MRSKIGASKSRYEIDAETADHADSPETMVKMVAVYRKDGGIKAFVQSQSVDSRTDEVMESSCDELVTGMGKGGSDTGSNGWMRQTIAKLGGAGIRQYSTDTEKSNSSKVQPELTESTGIVQQTVHKLEMEHLRKVQQRLECSAMLENNGVAEDVDQQCSGVTSARSSAEMSSLTGESGSEYLDPHPAPEIVDMKEIEKVVGTVIERKLCEFKDKYDVLMQQAFDEQEQRFQKTVDALVKQMNGRIDDTYAKLEVMFTKALQDKADSEMIDERVQRNLQMAQEDWRTSLQNEVDDKVKPIITDIKQCYDQMTANFESKVNDFILLIEDSEQKVQQRTELIMEKADKMEKEINEVIEECSENRQKFDEELDEITSRIMQAEENLAEATADLTTLNDELGDLDSKIQQQHRGIIEEVNELVDEKINEMVADNNLNTTVETINKMYGDFEKKLPDMVSQECDGKIGTMVMDMMDKSSQDFFRALEDRVQTMQDNLMKQITNTMDLKLRDLAGTHAKEETSGNEIYMSMMETVTKEIDGVTERIGTDISDIRESVERLKSILREQEESKSIVEATAANETQLETVDEKLQQITQMSDKLDNKASALSALIEECKMCIGGVKETTRQLHEESESIVAQVRESVAMSTRQIEASRKDSESAIEANRELLMAAIRDSVDIHNALKRANEDFARHTMTATSFTASENPIGNVGTRPKMFNPHGANVYSTTALQFHPGGMKEDLQHHACPNICCGITMPNVRGDAPNSYCSIAPVGYSSNTVQRDMRAMYNDSPCSDPSRRVEVKYIDMNGQRIKVTQEHVTLSDMANRPPIVVPGSQYPQNAVKYPSQMYYQ